MAVNPAILERNRLVKEARGLTISIDGLASLTASVRAMSRDAEKDLKAGLTAAMVPVTAEARRLAPYKTGRLSRSLKPFARANAVGVRSLLPYANVQHWGGTTGKGHVPGQPWSGSVYVHPTLFVSRAIDKHEDQIVEDVWKVMEDHALRTGWIAGAGVAVRLTQAQH